MCLLNKENKNVQLFHNKEVLKNKIMFIKRNIKKAISESLSTNLM